MNVLFLNSFERKEEGTEGQGASLSVSEQAGEFYVSWNQTDELPPQIWYQGGEWDDAISSLRSGLLSSLKEGWTPLFKVLEMSGDDSGQRVRRRTLMLQYYAEQHGDAELFEKLRIWRKGIASKQGVAPFIVSSNRTLAMISAFVPHTIEELKQIPGFGETRSKLHGEAILSLTDSYLRENEFPLDWIEQAVDSKSLERWLEEQRLSKETDAQEKKVRRKLLLERIAAADTIAEIAERTSINRRDISRELEQLDREGYDVEPVIAKELSGVLDEELMRAMTLMLEMSDRFLKPIVEKLYTAEQLNAVGVDRAYEWLRLLRIRFRREKEAGQSAAG